MIDKDILPCLCGKSTIPLKLQGKQMLVLGMDENRRDIVGPIIATVLEALIRANFADGQRVDPLAIFVDELPSIYLPNLGDWLNQLRSRGACFYLGFQTISLLERAYQEAGLKAILTGCNTKIIFNPNEFDSADYFSKFLGEIELNFSQRTRSQGGQGGSSNSYADQRQTRSLITADEINRLPQGHCILINPEYGNKKEAYVPQRLNIQVGDDAIFKAQFGAANFPLIIQMLQQHKAQDAVIDLEARTSAIDQLIPPLAEEGAKQSWQDAMGDALASAVAQPVVKEKQVKQSIEDAIRAAQTVPF
jgi:type IV secretory pathway TraG/TraD family ATPase VirD4